MTRAAFVVTIEVAPEVESAWIDWFPQHVRDVIRQPGFGDAVWHRDEVDAADGWRRYVVHYHLLTREAFTAYVEGGAARTLRAEYGARFGTTTRIFRQILVEIDRFESEPV